MKNNNQNTNSKIQNLVVCQYKKFLNTNSLPFPCIMKFWGMKIPIAVKMVSNLLIPKNLYSEINYSISRAV